MRRGCIIALYLQMQTKRIYTSHSHILSLSLSVCLSLSFPLSRRIPSLSVAGTVTASRPATKSRPYMYLPYRQIASPNLWRPPQTVSTSKGLPKGSPHIRIAISRHACATMPAAAVAAAAGEGVKMFSIAETVRFVQPCAVQAGRRRSAAAPWHGHDSSPPSTDRSVDIVSKFTGPRHATPGERLVRPNRFLERGNRSRGQF